MPVKKEQNKLLKALGGKIVTVTMKYSQSMKGNPVVMGVLLDADEDHYYLGENTEVTVAVPKVQVNMIADASLDFDEEPVDNKSNKKPFGEKFQ